MELRREGFEAWLEEQGDNPTITGAELGGCPLSAWLFPGQPNQVGWEHYGIGGEELPLWARRFVRRLSDRRWWSRDGLTPRQVLEILNG